MSAISALQTHFRPAAKSRDVFSETHPHADEPRTRLEEHREHRGDCCEQRLDKETGGSWIEVHDFISLLVRARVAHSNHFILPPPAFDFLAPATTTGCGEEGS